MKTSAFVRHVEVPLRIEYGVDRSGGDLPGMPIRLDCGADALTCEDMCYVRADCVAWAASTCGSRQCWLKQQVPAASTASCRVSVFITICAWHALKDAVLHPLQVSGVKL